MLAEQSKEMSEVGLRERRRVVVPCPKDIGCISRF